MEETQPKRRFTGAYLRVLNIDCTRFDGYGFEFIKLGYNIAYGITTSYSKTLLAFNAYKDTCRKGIVWKYTFTLFFYTFQLKNIIIEPREYCHWCNYEFSDPGYDYNGHQFCGAGCQSYHKDEDDWNNGGNNL